MVLLEVLRVVCRIELSWVESLTEPRIRMREARKKSVCQEVGTLFIFPLFHGRKRPTTERISWKRTCLRQLVFTGQPIDVVRRRGGRDVKNRRRRLFQVVVKPRPSRNLNVAESVSIATILCSFLASELGASILEPDLDSNFWQFHLVGQRLTGVHIWIMALFEGSLKFVQLERGEGCSIPTLFLILVFFLFLQIVHLLKLWIVDFCDKLVG